MIQPTLDDKQLAELADSLELAITLEQQAKNLCDLAEGFAEKYEKRLHKIREAAKQKVAEN
ncbi:hypothetical protein [Argonema galeatum]|uniref:hypothetical protein n=1 Tax=Argonema galeatum TaxID=2942762 RepID=UPI0020131AE8|nr:hypothetical protein [Argonema galeatum]MCL1468359.1 hypothetical protein [Argonema galeatum A003/A1]